jgi:hypothetical protein
MHPFFHTDYPAHQPDRADSLDDGPCDGPTNGANAKSAAAAIKKPARYQSEECFSDLICNLLHLAHSKELDLQQIIRTAVDNFHMEAAELPTEPEARTAAAKLASSY